MGAKELQKLKLVICKSGIFILMLMLLLLRIKLNLLLFILLGTYTAWSYGWDPVWQLRLQLHQPFWLHLKPPCSLDISAVSLNKYPGSPILQLFSELSRGIYVLLKLQDPGVVGHTIFRFWSKSQKNLTKQPFLQLNTVIIWQKS